MTGIRVTGVPDDVSEKQLKAYFRNPKNGGGPVREIYYPLQAHSAVILFDSPTGMLLILHIWPTDLADRVRYSLEAKSSQP